jgi:BirA family biotin operon repressor/biotin-[acetyl-CoA-carboxylase] ligase
MLKNKHVNYIHFISLDSTNTWAKNNAQMLDQGAITCITAQEQTSGRGRFFRRWLSPRGQNIYATFFFQIPKSASYAPNIGQVLSISCCSVLRDKGFSPQIKWPNDLLLEGKKVAGILCEMISMDSYFGVILGFGINVNMSQELLDTIDQPATSLANQSGKDWKLEEILEAIVKKFTTDLSSLERLGFPYFAQMYEDLLAFKGQLMSWSDGIRQIKGICHSISEDGKLNIIVPSGEMISLSSGEIKAL